MTRNPNMKSAGYSRASYRFSMALWFACVFLVLSVAATAMDIYHASETVVKPIGVPNFSEENQTSSAAAPPKSLLALSGGADEGGTLVNVNRVGGSGSCTKESILVFQGPTDPLPSGIPTYTVQVQNVCVAESCSISNIHLTCGWFSSARLVNPRVFRRLDYDDCLVNDGQPLNPGQSLSFQYANTFAYPMSVSSVEC